jgi:hypothetical protein
MSHAARTWRAQKALLVAGIIGLTVLHQSFGAAAQQATPTAALATPAVIAPGSMTAEHPYLIAEEDVNITITPLLTTGEMVGDYQMAGVPDGLGAVRTGDHVILLMNHELSAEDDGNLTDSKVSRLVLDLETGAVLSGSYVITGDEGYWSLCSASLAGPDVGFDAPVFLTGEESTDGPHGGIAMAIAALGGKVTELPWLGKFAHENQVVVPGFEGKTVVFATEDDSEGSQLYMYVADSPADFLAGNGELFVFKADDAADTADIAKGDELTGSFIPVDQADNVDAQTLETKVRGDGAFTFIRLEDITYDRTYPNTIYFTDTGDDEAPNLAADGTPLSLNGRLYQMTLDPADPTTVTGLTVLLDGDDGDDIHNPDNIDADVYTIMLQEDTSAGVGRILEYSVADGTLTPVATLDQSDSDEQVDPTDEPEAWESSGIINVSHIFGQGAWLADVQAHSLTVPQFGGEDEGGQLLLIREG